MINLIQVDIFMSENWLPQIFYGSGHLSEDIEPLNIFFDDNGYSSKSIIKNIGSALVFLVIYFSLWILIVILRIIGICSPK
jgi:hypothetical protein